MAEFTAGLGAVLSNPVMRSFTEVTLNSIYHGHSSFPVIHKVGNVVNFVLLCSEGLIISRKKLLYRVLRVRLCPLIMASGLLYIMYAFAKYE